MAGREDSHHEPAPAGAEGASAFGHRLPAGEDVLGPEELSDQDARMDLVERTTDIPPPGRATKPGHRQKASDRLAKMKANRRAKAR
jgi:hypothetical protein